MIAIIGTSDRPCWLAEACKILLLLLLHKNRQPTNLLVLLFTLLVAFAVVNAETGSTRATFCVYFNNAITTTTSQYPQG